jgi:hypothetical protein
MTVKPGKRACADLDQVTCKAYPSDLLLLAYNFDQLASR